MCVTERKKEHEEPKNNNKKAVWKDWKEERLEKKLNFLTNTSNMKIIPAGIICYFQ